MSRISLGHIISEAQAELGLSGSETISLFKVWAYDAQRSIGFSDLYKKEGQWQNLEGNAIKKPKDMAIPITVSLSTNKRDCIEPVFSGDFDKCGCTTNYNSTCSIKMGENDVEFYFSDNSYRYVKIKYLSHPVDENGDPLLDEVNARAIKQYINYMYTRRERKKNRKLVPQSEVDGEYQIWIRLRNEAIGDSNMPKPHQLKEIGEKWMATGVTPADVIDSRYGSWFRGTSCNVGSGSSSSSTSSDSELPSSYTFVDSKAIHTNVANEILGLVELASPDGTEYLIAEKSDGSKIRIKVSNLPTASGGEVNIASNVGASGIGFYDSKTGVDLRFRKIDSANNKISIALNGQVVELTINEANFALYTAVNNLLSQYNNHAGNTDIHFEMGDISITESQISDLQSYALQSALTAAIATIPTLISQLTNDTGFITTYVVTESDVTSHEGAINHNNISNVGTNTHAQIDSHIADSDIHFEQSAISIVESQISDLQSYALQSALDALTTALSNHTSDSSIHFEQSDIVITESQISDLQNYALQSTLTAAIATIPTLISQLTNDTGFITTYTVTESDVTNHEGAINHDNIQNVGTNSHAQIDSHIANDSIHFEKSDILYTEGLSLSDKTSDLVAHATDVVGYWDATFDGELVDINQGVDDAPTGQGIIIDAKIGGVSMLSTLSQIDATKLTTMASATPAVISSGTFSTGDRIEFIRTQVGSTNAGKWHQVYITYKRT